MFKKRLLAMVLLLIAIAIGYFVYNSETNPDSRFHFKLGLDLSGGTHLVYRADTNELQAGDIAGAMEALRDVIERRVNLFGVAEPIVQVEEGGIFGGSREERLIVELPGVTDVNEAVKKIGETPLLEFKIGKDTTGLTPEQLKATNVNDLFISTRLTGRYLDSAEVLFDQNTRQPKVLLNFSSEGADIFAEITKANVGKILAIFLDGVPISSPVIRQEITGGKAEITGTFTPNEVKLLVRDLNYGALPVPIELVSTQTIGPSLGEVALHAGIKAGVIAYIVIALFLLIWYRLPGLVAIIALAIYVALNLALFKLIPVTLTAAGIAGFILSLGMAVDANILIFERLKEELRRGKNLDEAASLGFSRAWLSIRDSNLSSIITAIILFWFASNFVIKGFALVFGLGVLTSMLTAITISRSLLRAILLRDGKVGHFLFSSGVSK